MKTTKRIVCVLCGVLALCLLFHAPMPVQASDYGTYGYSIRDINGQYKFQSFDETVSMYRSLNDVAGIFYTEIREEYPNGAFNWYGQDGAQLNPLDFYLSSDMIQSLKDLDLSNPAFLVNVMVRSTNNRWEYGTPIFFFTKDNNSVYSYDSDTHYFYSEPFIALPDIVPQVVSTEKISFFDGNLIVNTDNTNTEASSYADFDVEGGSVYVTNNDDANTLFNAWLSSSEYNSLLVFPSLYTPDNTMRWLFYYKMTPLTNAGFLVPIAIQSRLYKLNTGYALHNYGRNGAYYNCIYATSLNALSETPLVYYAEPFSTYINAPWVTPTPIPVQPTRPLVLPTFQPFATPTPITGVIVPTYNTDDDPGSVIGYALGNVTSEFIKPIYSMIVSVINYMFYNNIWFSFLVVAPSIAFIVFIIGRLRKK